MSVRVLHPDEALPWLSEQEGEAGLVLTAPEDEQGVERHVFQWMGLAQACAQRGDTHLWYLTRGGAATHEGEQLSPSGSLFSALARTLLVEFPETAGGWCDTDSWANLDRAALWEGCSTATRADGLRSAQLTRCTAQETHAPLPETWVITGGLGALGLHTARALVNRGALELHLVGRTPLTQLSGTDKTVQVEAIRQRGCRVSTHAADVTDPDAMRAIFTAIDADRIGLIHAAGVTEPTPSALADAELVQRVLAPKVHGARALDTCLEDAPVTHVVAFGSIAAVWGSRDLAPYAAANGFLAGWAHQLEARGVTARCVQWGPWSSGGMIGETEAYELGLYGLTPLNPGQAAAALDEALRQSDPAPIAVEADWPTLRDHLSRTVSGDLFMNLAAEPTSGREAPGSPRAPHPVLDPAEATAIILREAEAILRPPTPLSTEVPLIEAGLDSLMATELRNTLGEHGLAVPLGRLLGGPSVEELVSIALAPHAPSSLANPEDEEDVPRWMWWTHLAALIVGAAIATGVAVLIQRLNG